MLVVIASGAEMGMCSGISAVFSRLLFVLLLFRVFVSEVRGTSELWMVPHVSGFSGWGPGWTH